MRIQYCILALAALAGCDAPQSAATDIMRLTEEVRHSEAATLYRNSPLSAALRVHFATYDASDGIEFNLSNCEMTARLLNANIRASAAAEGKRPYDDVGFWCEVGEFSASGPVPADFPPPEFPTDTRAPMRFTQ